MELPERDELVHTRHDPRPHTRITPLDYHEQLQTARRSDRHDSKYRHWIDRAMGGNAARGVRYIRMLRLLRLAPLRILAHRLYEKHRRILSTTGNDRKRLNVLL